MAAQRAIPGTAAEKISTARAALWAMQDHPEQAYLCGPRAAEILARVQDPTVRELDLSVLRPREKGTSLLQLWKWSEVQRLGWKAVKRPPGAPFIAPAILHWKQGHFSVVLERKEHAYRVVDPVFGEARWLSPETLDEEASGYVLMAANLLPGGWQGVPSGEASEVWGRGYAPPGDDGGCGRGGSGGGGGGGAGGGTASGMASAPTGMPGESTPRPPGSGGSGSGCGSCGPSTGIGGGVGQGGGAPVGGGGLGMAPTAPPMAQYTGYLGSVSLSVTDTPVGYQPPRGPSVRFPVGYYQRDARYPQSPNFSNLGARWSFGWLCYLLESVPAGSTLPSVVQLIHGLEPVPYDYVNFDPVTKTSDPQFFRHDRLLQRPDGTYELQKGDGAKEIYSLGDGSSNPRRLFLTQVQDSAGNTVALTYDASFRLVAITDALGQFTTLSYGLPGFPYRITQVMDPFGRSAQFVYDASGTLAQIVDVIGLRSSFTYGDGTTPDFMTTLTTPYGTHSFFKGESGTDRWLESLDPLGGRERWEFRHLAPGIPFSDPQGPSGCPGPRGCQNWDLYYRNAFFWDKRAMALYPGDYTKAEIYQFLHIQTPTYSNVVSPVMQTRKLPLENRDWYFYAGQTAYRGTHWVGTESLPNRIVRILADGSERNEYFEYTPWAKVSKYTDPAGRQTSGVFSADGLDLLEVRNTTGGGSELLARYTYNPQHRPLTATDASGQTTSYTYNGFGQVLTITNPKNESTTFTYDPQGYLLTISGPATGTTTTFTYDAKGRVRTVTGPDGAATTTDYDDIDRPTLVTHLDGTTDQMVYDRLDLWKSKDRSGKWTYMSYNPLRQLVEVQDPSGRVTKFDWCGCGSQMEGLTDPMGRKTTWLRDLGGRVVSKILADGTATTYAYDVGGRLVRRTDAMGQRTQYLYGIDNNLLQVSYPNALKPAPSATYTYDAKYNRLATSTGAFGTTTYTYNAITQPPSPGAGRLASVAGPWANSTVTYSYDSLGRVQTRGINGVHETRSFDSLGRMGTSSNALGTFTYTYEGSTSRLTQVQFPNGQKTAFTYFSTPENEFRLSGITHKKSDNSTISSHGYTYSSDHQIQTWTQGVDAQTPKVWTFTYDAVSQLTGAVLNGPNGAIIRQFTYGYDPMGNRTTEDVDGATTTSAQNATNQLTGQRHALNSAALASRKSLDLARSKNASSKPAKPTASLPR
ncbi:MAG: hypothetical protein HY823_15390 [Acidobacteria bacterium]|nr:hypothetical protein [Acidobacteriota bacterium]